MQEKSSETHTKTGQVKVKLTVQNFIEKYHVLRNLFDKFQFDYDFQESHPYFIGIRGFGGGFSVEIKDFSIEKPLKNDINTTILIERVERNIEVTEPMDFNKSLFEQLLKAEEILKTLVELWKNI